MESLIDAIIGLFKGLLGLKFGKELLVFLISILPLLELRGGLLAASLLGVKPLIAYIVSILGNILPIPFILLFINKIIEWMGNSKIRWMRKFSNWLEKKANKNKKQIEKYGYLGLILFVGIPLPGTGAWTGCLAASVLGMNRKKSFFAILLGVIMASIIMMIISYGILGNLIK